MQGAVGLNSAFNIVLVFDGEVKRGILLLHDYDLMIWEMFR